MSKNNNPLVISSGYDEKNCTIWVKSWRPFSGVKKYKAITCASLRRLSKALGVLFITSGQYIEDGSGNWDFIDKKRIL